MRNNKLIDIVLGFCLNVDIADTDRITGDTCFCGKRGIGRCSERICEALGVFSIISNVFTSSVI